MKEKGLAYLMQLIEEAKDSGVKIAYSNDELLVKVAKGVKIDPSLLASIKSVKEELIGYFRSSLDSRAHSPLADIRPAPRTPGQSLPVSFAQERIWFIDQLYGSTNYHISSVLRLTGALDRSALDKALRQDRKSVV